MKQKAHRIGALLLFVFGSTNAFATDGYFSAGFGVKSQGIGGVGIALPQDGLAAASNPAGTAWVGDRIDAGLSWFGPKRSADIVDSPVPGANGSYDGNNTENFFIPEFGYAKQLSNTTAVGVAVYGNGGMNTDYGKNPFGAFGSTGSAGVNLEQLFITPSVAYKVDAQNSIGAGLNFVYQRFSAKGLDGFATSSSDAGNLTDRGTDSSTGWGLHLGWIGHITPDLSLGATWSSKINAGKFGDYSGLFADGGSFDIPENYGAGIAFKATPAVTLAADIEEIKYGSVSSIANPLSNLFSGNPLGSANGPGFGWRDITVVKVGASYDYTPDLTLRIGYNHSGQPIPDSQTFFNILAPGVVQDHLTLGSTWKTSDAGELSLFYAHAFKTEVNGSNSIPAAFGGGNVNIGMSQNTLGVAYGWKL
jgi:long-chain fatty acid transport protein